MNTEYWLRKTDTIIKDEKYAKRLLDEWKHRLGICDYAFTFELTKDRYEGQFTPIIGLHYARLEFSTERVLLHELIEAMLYRYFTLAGLDYEDKIEEAFRQLEINLEVYK